MPTTYYHTLNGELLGETGPGGRRFYGKDALGSVVATYDQNGTLENTYRYKPYGGLLSKTGSAPDPSFMWTGSTGSRTTGASYAEQYNRARHYGSRQAGWTSVDPLWPRQEPYVYVTGSPVSKSDPSGLDPSAYCPCRVLVWRKVELVLTCNYPHNEQEASSLCFTRPGGKTAACQADCCTAQKRHHNCSSVFRCDLRLHDYRVTKIERLGRDNYRWSLGCNSFFGKRTCQTATIDGWFAWRAVTGGIPIFGALISELGEILGKRGVGCEQAKNLNQTRSVTIKGKSCEAYDLQQTETLYVQCCRFESGSFPFTEVDDLVRNSDLSRCR